MRKHLSVREFRANLANITRAGEPVTIGDHFHVRAVFVPIPKHLEWSATAKVQANRAAARAARNLFAELRQGQ